MKNNTKIKTTLIICFLSISLLGIAVPAKSLNRCAWIEKGAEYLIGIMWPGWSLELDILAHRSYYSYCGHYYFSSDSVDYSVGYGTGYFSWAEYSEDIDYFDCPICHRLIIIIYEVHGRFSYIGDSSNYYDLTLAIEYDANDNIDATFGPFYHHLEGVWSFYEDSGIETS